MTKIELISRIEGKIRPHLGFLPSSLLTKIYSSQKGKFLQNFVAGHVNFKPDISPEHRVKIWGLEFNLPLFNSAGMFKHGHGYEVVARQGAGAYLAGTTTFKPRIGNVKNSIRHPFLSYPNSDIASNWMGLPNDGHEAVAKRLSKITKLPACPVGASLSTDPEDSPDVALSNLVRGLELYEKAKVDFIEINESCPNVEHGSPNLDSSGLDKDLINRLEYVAENFLKHRQRNLPVIVKLSNDTETSLMPPMLDILLALGFDGLNIGNTSTEYDKYSNSIHAKDKKNYEYFTGTFGGGLSGRILKTSSLGLCSLAQDHLSSKALKAEFHIIRTGGLESIEDVTQSQNKGIALNQWYTGYFSNFAKHGHHVYEELFRNHLLVA